MMRRCLATGLACALAAVAALGCGTSPPSRYYTLGSTATSRGTPAANYGVMVGPVSVPASVDRAEFMVSAAPNQVEMHELNRWAAPLGESIARTVAGDLAVLLGTPDVAVAPFANFDPKYRVTINVQRFDSMLGDSVLIEAVWAVRATEGGQTRSGRTVSRQAAEGADFDALAAAHSRALASLSSDIAAAIRLEAGAP